MVKVQDDLHRASLKEPFKPHFKIRSNDDEEEDETSRFASWAMVKEAYGDYATYKVGEKRKRQAEQFENKNEIGGGDVEDEGEGEETPSNAAKKIRVAEE